PAAQADIDYYSRFLHPYARFYSPISEQLAPLAEWKQLFPEYADKVAYIGNNLWVTHDQEIWMKSNSNNWIPIRNEYIVDFMPDINEAAKSEWQIYKSMQN